MVVFLLLVIVLWMAGGDSSMNYYQRDVQRAVRQQSKRERAELAHELAHAEAVERRQRVHRFLLGKRRLLVHLWPVRKTN